MVPLLPPHAGLTWLFPGRAAGRHIGAAALAARLGAHGIPARPARNAALLALAADLPVAVLSDLLGLSISTALSWTREASRDWIGFIPPAPPDQSEHSTRPPTDAGSPRPDLTVAELDPTRLAR
jgi:hypothetical protein